MGLWVWSILEDISVVIFWSRRPICLNFLYMALYNTWKGLRQKYYGVKVNYTTIGGQHNAMFSKASAIVKLILLVGVIYPKCNFTYADNFMKLKMFIDSAMDIQHNMKSIMVKDASTWCNLLLHGDENISCWKELHCPRICLEKEDDHSNVVNVLSKLLNGNEKIQSL
jgi:hypothetical protein